MSSDDPGETQPHALLMRRVLDVCSESEPMLVWSALLGLLLAGAAGLADQRVVIREFVREILRTIDALGDAGPDESQAILRETAWRQVLEDFSDATKH